MKLFKRKLKVEFTKEWQDHFSFDLHCHKYENNLTWHIFINIPFLFWLGMHTNGELQLGVLKWHVRLYFEKDSVKSQDPPFVLTFDMLRTALPANAVHSNSDFSVYVSEKTITINKKATQPGHGT